MRRTRRVMLYSGHATLVPRLTVEQKEKTHEQTGEARRATATDCGAAEIESRPARVAGAVSGGLHCRSRATRAPDARTIHSFDPNVDHTADTRCEIRRRRRMRKLSRTRRYSVARLAPSTGDATGGRVDGARRLQSRQLGKQRRHLELLSKWIQFHGTHRRSRRRAA